LPPILGKDAIRGMLDGIFKALVFSLLGLCRAPRTFVLRIPSLRKDCLLFLEKMQSGGCRMASFPG